MRDALLVLFWPVTVLLAMGRRICTWARYWPWSGETCRFCPATLGERHRKGCFMLFCYETADFWDTKRDFSRYFLDGRGQNPYHNPNVIHEGRSY